MPMNKSEKFKYFTRQQKSYALKKEYDYKYNSSKQIKLILPAAR